MKATKKLIVAAVSLALTASLTVGSTFAWFAYQSNVSLESVQFSVDSGDENLMVAVTSDLETEPAASSFAYSLSQEAIKNQINGGSDVVYQPLTVKDDGSNTVNDDNAIALVKSDESSTAEAASYAQFVLVFRYTPATGASSMPDLILDNGSQVNPVEPDGSAFKPAIDCIAWETTSKYGTAVTQDQPIVARASNAARVAFLYQSGGATKNKVWAPNEALAPLTEDTSSDKTSDTPKGFYLGNLASDYNIHHELTSIPVTAPTYAARVYAGISSPTQAEDFTNSTIATFPQPADGKSYSELKLTVKVWLEGKDGDCLPSVQEDIFAFLLKFRTSTIKEA